MKKQLTAAALLLCFLIPAGSQAQTPINAVTVELKPEKKLTWKDRHPKAYRRIRKVRAVCVFVGPIINVGANVFTAVGVFF